MLRKLGVFERALFLSDRHAPFNVISVLQLENAPAPETIRAALDMLQRRHPLLRAGIKSWGFIELPAQGFPLQVVERKGVVQWREIVEQELNTRLEISAGLSRGTYLFAAGRAELVLTFHRAIIDAASRMNLLDELLKACAGPTELPALPLVPPVEEQFPSAFKGLRGFYATLGYALAQMVGEAGFRWRLRRKRVPPVRLGGRGFASTLILPETLVDRLSQRSRKEKVTLNSLLSATVLLALNRHLYAGEPTPMHTFTFAGLRPYCRPPLPAENLANAISMMRLTLDVAQDDDVWQLAKILHGKFFRAFKHGEKFSAVRMSELLMKMFLSLKSMRMGSTGLNYSGTTPLQPT